MPDTAGHTEGTQRPCAVGGRSRQCRVSGHLLGTLAGSGLKGLVPGQMWRSRELGCDARCPHLEPQARSLCSHAEEAGRRAAARRKAGRTLPTPDPHQEFAKSLRVGRRQTVYSKDQAKEQTPPPTAPTHQSSAPGGISPAKGTVAC